MRKRYWQIKRLIFINVALKAESIINLKSVDFSFNFCNSFHVNTNEIEDILFNSNLIAAVIFSDFVPIVG